MRRKKLLLWFAIILIVLGLGTGAFFGYRAYKIAAVQKEEERLGDWLVSGVMKVNPVKLVGCYSFEGDHPNWIGDTGVDSLWETPTGAKVAVRALIRSSFTETRIVRLDVYYRGGPRIEDMTPGELAEAVQHASGITVDLPPDLVYSGKPLDLQKELPTAFGKPAP